MEEIKITINNRQFSCFAGQTVMEVARQNGIYVPGICYCPDLKPETSCRLCLVRIRGVDGLVTSCDTRVSDGMEVITEDDEIKRIRQSNLKLILSKHSKSCGSCRRVRDCKIIKAVKECETKNVELRDKEHHPSYSFGPAIIFDPNKCINCNNCIQVCNRQGVGYLENEKKEGFSSICPVPGKECIYCGQCLTHCPSGAFRESEALPDVEKILQDRSNHVIFQFSAPLIKSIGSEISPIWNKESIEGFSNFLLSQGAEMVFDTSFGVDMLMSRMIEEVIQGMDKGTCIFTSHCPSWVKYIQVYRPEFIPSLSKLKSPHLILSGAIKNFLVNERRLSAEKIFIVSIAPCTAKKYEIGLPSSRVEGIKSVDYSLTINELYDFLRKKKFNSKHLNQGRKNIYIKESHSYDSNEQIVMSGLSSLYSHLTGQELSGLEFKRIGGIESAIETSINIKGRVIKLAIAYGLESARKILDILEKDPLAYQCLEVMACPGGCLRGGGQLIRPEEINFNNDMFSGFYDDNQTKINSFFIQDIANQAKNIKEIFER